MSDSCLSLPQTLYSAAQVKAAEVNAVNSGACSLYELVEQAGSAAMAILESSEHCNLPTVILVGKGNNGADALVVARLLLTKGNRARVLLLGQGKTQEYVTAMEIGRAHV